MYEKIKEEASLAAQELLEAAKLHEGQIVIIGCSTSEVCGQRIGTASVPEVAEALYDEHLNRAVVTERKAVPGAEYVNVVPRPKAGGSFATAAYSKAEDPVVLEEIRADAGLDIGRTLIGMHLKKVAVPVRLEHDRIGEAIVTAARVRPKFIGGCRAVYDDNLM